MEKRVRNHVVAAGLITATMAVAAVGEPASGAVQVRPRAGAYDGTETGPGDNSAITFTVSKNRKVVGNLTGNAEARAGCTAHYTGFELPPGRMAITNGVHFRRSTTRYPGPKVRVTIVGHFTSATAAAGRIVVHFTTVKGCNATTPFTANRTGAATQIS
jgi:hypothetical protein